MHFRGRAGPPAHRWWHTGTQVGWTEEGQEDPIMALAAAPTEAPREAAEAWEQVAQQVRRLQAILMKDSRADIKSYLYLFVCTENI